MLSWSWAGDADAEEFAAFVCCDRETADPWVIEAENYVRGWVLGHADHVVAHRNEAGVLVAVTAFDHSVIGIPIRNPLDHPGWHLQVVAVSADQQNQGLSSEIVSGTFEAMRSVDRDRVYVTANVHRNNRASLTACDRAGIQLWYQRDDDYLVLLGEVPAD